MPYMAERVFFVSAGYHRDMADIKNSDIDYVSTRLPSGVSYDNATILQKIQATGSPEAALADFWDQQAAATSSYMTISESGSSRSMGDIYKNAVSMSEMWRKRAAERKAEENPGTSANVARTRKLVREGGF